MTRRGYVMATCLAVIGTTLASLVPVPPRLIWNASASVPIGFYDLDPPGHLEIGDLVAVLPDKPLADFLVERGYIGRDVPLMKRVMGLPASGSAASATPSRSTRYRLGVRSTATGADVRCRSGRAVAASPTVRFSS